MICLKFRPSILGVSKRGRHESAKRIDDFMCGLELKQIAKPRDDSIIETYRMGKYHFTYEP